MHRGKIKASPAGGQLQMSLGTVLFSLSSLLSPPLPPFLFFGTKELARFTPACLLE